MKRIADKLFDEDYHWSVLAAGRYQVPFVTQSALMGGHVRVGLEYSLYLARGELARSNAAQVSLCNILHEQSLEIATSNETRAMLGLKGGDDVSF